MVPGGRLLRNLKRAPTLLEVVIAVESPYHWTFRGAIGAALGGDLVSGTGCGRLAAGGRTGIGVGSATTPTPPPVTRLPPPAARGPSSGIERPAAGGGTGIGIGGVHAAVRGAWAGERAGS